MTLSVSNFFAHYVIHPRANELQKWEQNVALVSSITLLFLTFGLIYARAYVLSRSHQPLSTRNISVLSPKAQVPSSLRGSRDSPCKASFDEPKRLLLLDGDVGTVACRIYGHLTSATIPRFSDNGTLESATRSLLRMKNLAAVRGVPGACMVGPADYLGNLEEPNKYLYTIQNGSPPVFYRRPITDENCGKESNLKEFDNSVATVIGAHWVSGEKGDSIKEKKLEYNVTQPHLQQSLFPNPGILEIDRRSIELHCFDPRGVDLSSFKARLVDNNIPFQITKKKLPSKDEYRLVTYLYEDGYTDWQVKSGSGLFLEKHAFSQTITPITSDSSGFVALARTNENSNKLELIGIQIPYGHTLIIEEGCIHGDTTLKGYFMMGMTSDHTTMRTADTVFLKHPETKENVGMVMRNPAENEQTNHLNNLPSMEMPPYVIYKDANEDDRKRFRHQTQGKNFIFNPLSRECFRK
jgi:hypothetical protein